MISPWTTIISAIIGAGIGIAFAHRFPELFFKQSRVQIYIFACVIAAGFLLYFSIYPNVIFTHLSYGLAGFLATYIFFANSLIQEAIDEWEEREKEETKGSSLDDRIEKMIDDSKK